MCKIQIKTGVYEKVFIRSVGIGGLRNARFIFYRILSFRYFKTLYENDELLCIETDDQVSQRFIYTVEPVYIEHSREMKKCSMYAGVQCIQVLRNWRSGEIEQNQG